MSFDTVDVLDSAIALRNAALAAQGADWSWKAGGFTRRGTLMVYAVCGDPEWPDRIACVDVQFAFRYTITPEAVLWLHTPSNNSSYAVPSYADGELPCGGCPDMRVEVPYAEISAESLADALALMEARRSAFFNPLAK